MLFVAFSLQTTDLDFYIDIHAHSTLTNGIYFTYSLCVHTHLYMAVFLGSAVGFMYGNIYEDEERFERQAVFPKLLAQHAEDFSWVSTVA